jgi:hypothetical protein
MFIISLQNFWAPAGFFVYFIEYNDIYADMSIASGFLALDKPMNSMANFLF